MGLAGARLLCLYGFPENTRIDLDLQTPDGAYAHHGAFRMGTGSTMPGSGIAFPTVLPPVKELPTAVVDSSKFKPRLPSERLKLLPILPTGPTESQELNAVQLEPPLDEPDMFGLLHAARVNTTTVLTIPLWWPASLPSGAWIVKGEAAGASVEVPLIFEPNPGISTRPDAEVDPFLNHHCDVYDVEEVVVIEGTGLEPNLRLTLGLYRAEAYATATLADSASARTDDDGAFTLDHVVDVSYEEGLYYVLQAPVAEGSWFRPSRLPCFQVAEP
jgi:hypothetical protein